MRKLSWQKFLLACLVSLYSVNIGIAGGPWPFTRAWYAERSNDPPGTRQIDKHGKLWPPYARPIGRKQTAAHAYHYSHYWPYPQNLEDEAYVRNIIDMQTAGGWATATTLHDYYFNAENHHLTDGGRAHLLWISSSVPIQFRTVYVSQGNSREIGQLRAESIEEYFREMAIPNPPPVLTRAENFEGRPAVEVDMIRQLELKSIPRPRLFYIGSATAGGGTNGGASGAVPGGAGAPAGGAGATTTNGNR